jgi:hypothetical protein
MAFLSSSTHTHTHSSTGGKELWDAFEAKFGISDAGSELYVIEHVIEQFYDYRMVDDHPIINKLMSYKSFLRSLIILSVICWKN